MNKRTKQYIEEAQEIIDELEPVYDQDENSELTSPLDYLPMSHKTHFKIIFENMEKAVQNLYTEEESVRKEIVKYMTTFQDLQDGAMNLSKGYEKLYRFFHNQLKPIVNQAIGFCKNKSTEISNVNKEAEGEVAN